MKIAIRLLAVILLAFSFNYLYTLFWYESDIQKHSSVVNLSRAIPDSTTIVYIGESSNNTFRANDIDKRKISYFIADYYPSLRVSDITKPATHAGIYKHLLRHIPHSANVKTVVVTLNMRSFNAQWIYSDLETALQKSMVLLKPYPPLLNRLMLSFKAYEIKTPEERSEQFNKKWRADKFDVPFPFQFEHVKAWDGHIFTNGMKNQSGERDDALTELACHYVKGYGFQIDFENNPRIKDFDEIVKLAKERNWNLIFNLLAENHEKAESLVGKELTYLMNENREKLIEYYTNKGVTVVDNFYAVEDEQFIDQHWTTEHYAEKGRKAVAKGVADSLKKFYSSEYITPNHSTYTQCSFFNDCEGETIWGQMQTRSNEKAFSGKYASKTDKNQQYSISFDYPFTAIPDSCKDSISVNTMVHITESTKDIILTIQFSGDSTPNYWNGIKLSEHISETKTWTEFNYTMEIPRKIKKADLVKVYLYNNSNKTVYLDDFAVKFH